MMVSLGTPEHGFSGWERECSGFLFYRIEEHHEEKKIKRKNVRTAKKKSGLIGNKSLLYRDFTW